MPTTIITNWCFFGKQHPDNGLLNFNHVIQSFRNMEMSSNRKTEGHVKIIETSTLLVVQHLREMVFQLLFEDLWQRENSSFHVAAYGDSQISLAGPVSLLGLLKEESCSLMPGPSFKFLATTKQGA